MLIGFFPQFTSFHNSFYCTPFSSSSTTARYLPAQQKLESNEVKIRDFSKGFQRKLRNFRDFFGLCVGFFRSSPVNPVLQSSFLFVVFLSRDHQGTPSPLIIFTSDVRSLELFNYSLKCAYCLCVYIIRMNGHLSVHCFSVWFSSGRLSLPENNQMQILLQHFEGSFTTRAGSLLFVYIRLTFCGTYSLQFNS